MGAAWSEESAETTPDGYSIQQEILGIGSYEGAGTVYIDRGQPRQQPAQVVTGGLMPRFSPARTTPGAPTTATYNQLMGELFNKSPSELAAFQQELYDADYYTDTAYTKDDFNPRSGYVDDYTKSAAKSLFSDAVLYGKNKTVRELLEDRKKSAKEMGGPGAKVRGTQGRQGTVYQQIKSDPASLREAVREISRHLLGRNVDDAERDTLVEAILNEEAVPANMETAANKAAAKAGGTDTALTTYRMDAEARLQEKIRAGHGTEVNANAQLEGYNVLSQLISEM